MSAPRRGPLPPVPAPARPAKPQAKFLTVKEVAARLRVSKMTVYRLIHDSYALRAVQVGRSYRVPESAVDEFLAAAEVGEQP